MTQAQTFDSLADAVRATFPPEFCRVAAMREDGDLGYVLFDTRPGGESYLYGVDYERHDGRWTEGSSGNGPGWSRITLESDVGILADWGDAPAGADRVRLEFQGQLREEEVNGGVYLAVWWNVPHPADGAWPLVWGFRINGTWIAQP
jgi:hypothetical protein